MNKHLIPDKLPEKRPYDTPGDTSVSQRRDEDAGGAVVGAAGTGTLDNVEPGTVSAAVRTVRALRESTDRAAGGEITTGLVDCRWAAGGDLSADEPVGNWWWQVTQPTLSTGAAVNCRTGASYALGEWLA